MPNEPILRNPNDIRVQISDPVPIVVLFGPWNWQDYGIGASGTMAGRTGYSLRPHLKFRHSYCCSEKCDPKTFRRIYYCDSPTSENKCTCNPNRYDRDSRIFKDRCSPRTKDLSLIMVSKRGRSICQILDVPGQHCYGKYFNSGEFPCYLQDIINSRNQKIWMFFVNLDWPNEANRLRYMSNYPRAEVCYTQFVGDMKRFMHPCDRAIFTCTKIDRHPNVVAFNAIRHLYPGKAFAHEVPNGIFEPYMNRCPLTKWFRPYNFDFVTFSACRFEKCSDGNVYYTQNKDIYPATLWKAIMRAIK